MIFTRRSIQRCLNELSGLPRDALQNLVEKLNQPNAARLPAMWEVVILHALSGLGRVEYEKEHESGRRPDIAFAGKNGVAFVADVTCISDAGLDEANPIEELSEAIEACKTRLGLPAGGMSLRVEAERSRSKRGERTTLLLPPRGRIKEYVKKHVEPAFREQLQAGATELEYAVDQEGVRFAVQVKGERFNSISHPSYNSPGSLLVNPLYNALNNKAKQLRDIKGVKGIIVCDGDCDTLRPTPFAARQRFSSREILQEFLRQNSSIRFAVTISVKEDQARLYPVTPERKLVVTLEAQKGFDCAALATLFHAMLARMPQPKDTPVNAALRAREPGFGWGKHGGLSMSRKSLKMSSRLLVEVLAGKRSIEDLNRFHRWRSKADPQDNATTPNPFERWLDQGSLPTEIIVEPDPEGTDDWVEFRFGEPDPAVTPFRVPDQDNNRSGPLARMMRRLYDLIPLRR